jgi:hypothetical protein
MFKLCAAGSSQIFPVPRSAGLSSGTNDTRVIRLGEGHYLRYPCPLNAKGRHVRSRGCQVCAHALLQATQLQKLAMGRPVWEMHSLLTSLSCPVSPPPIPGADHSLETSLGTLRNLPWSKYTVAVQPCFPEVLFRGWLTWKSCHVRPWQAVALDGIRSGVTE